MTSSSRRHITDSDSWPLDLASHPELAAHGAYSAEQKYTDSDIAEIIRFAGEVSLYRLVMCVGVALAFG